MFDNIETIYHGKDSCYSDGENRISQIQKELSEKKDLNVVTPEIEIGDAKGSVFYDKIKFLLIQLVIFGVIPVCKPGGGKMRHFLIYLYCAVAYSIITSVSWIEFKIVSEEMKTIGTLADSVETINRLLFLSHQFSIFFCVWPQSFYVMRNFRQWSEYQDQYERVTHQSFKLNVKSCIQFSLVNWFILGPFSGFYYRNINSETHQDIWQVILYTYLTQTAVIVMQIWYFIAKTGETVIQDFLQQMKQRFNNSISASELQEYRLLWLKLSQLICDAGTMFSIPIAQIVMGLFINVVVYSYVTVFSVITSVLEDAISYRFFYNSFVVQVSIVFCFYVICHKGYTVSQQSQVLRRHLIDMKIPNTALNESTLAELRIFIRSVNMFPVEFSIRGIKLINKAMFVAILGDIVTYVIILVQFNLSLQSGSSPPIYNCSTSEM